MLNTYRTKFAATIASLVVIVTVLNFLAIQHSGQRSDDPVRQSSPTTELIDAPLLLSLHHECTECTPLNDTLPKTNEFFNSAASWEGSCFKKTRGVDRESRWGRLVVQLEG